MNDITIDNAGVALAASVYGRPELPPVLLMHGISNSRDVWYDWAVELSDRYRVYALDFRGHGHSARAERYGIADYVSDATAILTAIGGPTRIVGHSLGGVVAGALAQSESGSLGHAVYTHSGAPIRPCGHSKRRLPQCGCKPSGLVAATIEGRRRLGRYLCVLPEHGA